MLTNNSNSDHKSGTYAKFVPDDITKKRISTVINMINVENSISESAMHVTLIYSTRPCPDVKLIELPDTITAHGHSFDLFENPDGTNCLVLKLHSEQLQELHATCRDTYRATHDFPEYNPHVTLSYDYTQPHVPNNSLIEFFKNLTFDQFVIEPLLL